MRKFIVTLIVLVVVTLASVAPALASCTYHTYFVGGRYMTCTTCCYYGGRCTTNCY